MRAVNRINLLFSTNNRIGFSVTRKFRYIPSRELLDSISKCKDETELDKLLGLLEDDRTQVGEKTLKQMVKQQERILLPGKKEIFKDIRTRILTSDGSKADLEEIKSLIVNYQSFLKDDYWLLWAEYKNKFPHAPIAMRADTDLDYHGNTTELDAMRKQGVKNEIEKLLKDFKPNQHG